MSGCALSGCSAVLTDAAVMVDRFCASRAGRAAALLSTLFVGAALIAHHAGAGTAVDHAVWGWMVHHRTPALTWWAIAVTEVGSPVGVGVLALLASVVLWRRFGSPWPAVVVMATVAAAGAMSTAVKAIVGAHRPPQGLQLILETDPSFPSGHVTGTVALLGALSAVGGYHAGAGARRWWIAVTVAGTAAVAVTRLYLGVHWVSDVLGGVLLGALAAVLAGVLYRRLERSVGADIVPAASSTSGPIPTVGASPE